jgi:uncharacterized membrane protein
MILSTTDRKGLAVTTSRSGNARVDAGRGGAGPLARAFAAAVLAALMLVAPSTAYAKSFSMPSARIEAQVAADGSLTVNETRSFEFIGGEYTRVFWELEPPAAGTVVDIAVTDASGKPVPPAPAGSADARPAGFSRIVAEGGLTRVDVYGLWTDTTVDYTISYRLTNAAVRWADTSELYWFAVAKNWGASTRSVEGIIRLPAGVKAEQVKVWVHGPLTGSSRVNDDGSVTFSVNDLAASTPVEPRVLFPAVALSGMQASAEPRLQKVLDEEGALADAANAQRAEAKRQLEEDKRIAAVIAWSGAFLALLLLTIVVVLFFRYGREYRPTFAGQYFREVPEQLHPALVGHLMSMGTVPDRAISASIMDLSDRGVLRMEPTALETAGFFGTKTEQTYLMTLDTTKWGTLSALDQNLLSLLFTTIAGDSTLTIAEMQDWAKANAQEFQTGLNEFKAAVAVEAEARGFLEKSSKTASSVAWVLTILAGLFGCGGAVFGENLVVGVLAVVALATMVVLSVNMARRSTAAAEMHAKYAAVRNYLRDFSRLQEAPPSSVVLWNQFLVLAVVFGIADVVIEQLKVAVPQVVSDPAFATTYWWVASGTGYDSPISSLSGGFTSAAQIASSQLSSSSGGGGGFSGGGGGGSGGGGGGGAD